MRDNILMNDRMYAKCGKIKWDKAVSKNREIKDALFDQVARITKAAASPKRLELIELLCQAPKPVETLAREAEISIKLTSAHLKELRNARLVQTERRGKQIIYSLSSVEVSKFWVVLRLLAEDRLFELQDAMRQLAEANGEWRNESQVDLLRKAEGGEIVIIDVRPDNEYTASHLPFARSMPLSELQVRLQELPRDKPVVAYCRGPYCLMAGDAVRLLRANGFQAFQMKDGVSEWGAIP